MSQAARNFGFADAGRADHENIFRRDFLSQRFRHLAAAPAIPQRDCDRALGGMLADDMFIEFVDDFLRGHGGHKKRA